MQSGEVADVASLGHAIIFVFKRFGYVVKFPHSMRQVLQLRELLLKP